jgi:hypothetical protein
VSDFNNPQVRKLYDTLRKVQEPKGYYFNVDTSKVAEKTKSVTVICAVHAGSLQ